MVKVITIMDDVYAELYHLKKSKGMSFSEIIRYLLRERGEVRGQLLGLAGSIDERDVERRKVEKMRVI